MYDLLLMVHFFGLAIGAGTPFYMAAVGVHAEKSNDPSHIKAVMLGPGGAVSSVGTVGLLLLILSGTLLLMLMDSIGHLDWAFAAKVGLAVLTILYVALMKLLSRKAKHDEGMATMATIKKLGPIGLLLSLAIIVCSVLAFH